MQDAILTMNHINKSYGNTQVLNNIDMEIPQGAIYGLVGSNGAGKSTLMRIISGQTQCSSGTFSLFGETVDNNHPKVRHRIGTLIENPGFIHHMTAAQNLEYFRIQFGVPGKERVDELLNLVGLSHAGKKKYKNFSMGMKQRLGLALALLHSPEFLILDEPINGLDPEGIRELRNLFLELNQKRNITLLISSHILSELENIATEYAFLSEGNLLEQISARELQKKCSAYIDLEVSNARQMCTVLEMELNIHDYQVHPQGHIHIFHAMGREEEITRTAILKDVSVKSISRHSDALETYYMRLVGGKKDV